MDNRLNTLFVGKVLLRYPRLDSTNLEAERLLSNGQIADGTVIITAEQTNGRGQMGNTWYSGIGKNLAVSIIFFPKFLHAQQQFSLNQAMSLAIKDCLSQYIDDVSIKWPNDIFIGNKKISGMLIQNSLSGHTLKSSIIGIGINLNQVSFPDNAGKPISLYQVTREKIDQEKFLASLCPHIEKRYLQLKRGQFSQLHSDYHKYLYLKGIEHHYIDNRNGEHFKGTISEVLLDGRLEVNTEDGVRHFMFKEISLA